MKGRYTRGAVSVRVSVPEEGQYIEEGVHDEGSLCKEGISKEKRSVQGVGCTRRDTCAEEGVSYALGKTKR